MFARENRIRKKKDFELIFKKSKSFKNSLFTFRVMENNLGFSRFGFVTSLKVSKKATVRNKIRRRLTEVIKAQEKNIKKGIDLVIIALPEIEKKEFSEVKDAINSALIKAKCLTP